MTDWLCREYVAIAKEREDVLPDARAALLDNLRSVQDISRYRNRLVHDVWIRSLRDGHHAPVGQVTIGEIAAVVERYIQISEDLLHWIWRNLPEESLMRES
jgi:hypothetical protein